MAIPANPEIIAKTVIKHQKDIEALKTQLDDLQTLGSSVRGENEKLCTLCSDLQKQCNELKNIKGFESRITKLESQITNLRSLLETKAAISTLENKIRELSTRLDNLSNALSKKAEKGETGASASDLSEVRSNHGFNTCVFLCAILIFNILAISLIIGKPGYFGETDGLPWFYILPLITCMLLNIVGIIIWIYHFSQSAVDYEVWEYVVEVGLLLFNMVAIWLFAFHPLEEVTSAAIALIVILALANLLILVMRILYFVDEHTLADVDKDVVSLTVNIIGTILLVVVLIIFIFWIRV